MTHPSLRSPACTPYRQAVHFQPFAEVRLDLAFVGRIRSGLPAQFQALLDQWTLVQQQRFAVAEDGRGRRNEIQRSINRGARLIVRLARLCARLPGGLAYRQMMSIYWKGVSSFESGSPTYDDLYAALSPLETRISEALTLVQREVEAFEIEPGATGDEMRQKAAALSRSGDDQIRRLLLALGLDDERPGHWRRVRDPHFLMRRMDKAIRQVRERLCQLLAPTAMNSTSPDGRRSFEAKRDRAAEFAKKSVLVQERSGRVIEGAPLLDPILADRRQQADYIDAARAFDELGRACGLSPHLVTVTLPPLWHPTTSVGGTLRRNPAWNQRSARDAHQFARRRFDRFRAKIRPLGGDKWPWMRMVHPHRDGTPHYHLLLWLPPQLVCVVERVLSDLFKAGDGLGSDPYASAVDCRRLSDRDEVVRVVSYGTRAYNAFPQQPGEVIAKTDAVDRTAMRAYGWSHGIRLVSMSRRFTTLTQLLRNPEVDLIDEDARQVAAALARGDRAAVITRLEESSLKLVYEETENAYGESVQRLIGYRNEGGVFAPKPRWRLEQRDSEGDSTVGRCKALFFGSEPCNPYPSREALARAGPPTKAPRTR